VAAFHFIPMHDLGPEEFQRPGRVCVCLRVPMNSLASSVVVGVEGRPPFGDPGCALRHCPAPVLLSHPGVELELELLQSHTAQKPVLRGEVGARALRVRLVSREEAWASAGVQGAWVGGCGCEAD
jgi:hypothetical protein